MSDLEEYSESESEAEDYPLKNTWTVFDHNKSDSNNYDSNTRIIGNISSVVDFWRFFNFYPKPSQIFNNGACKPTMGSKEISSVSFFKKGIFPKWEDPLNKIGAEVAKKRFDKKDPLHEVDANWLELLLCCIGEQISDCVTGVRIVDSSNPNLNKNDGEFKLLYRVELWFSDITKRKTIEDNFKNILNIDSKLIHYKEHTPR